MFYVNDELEGQFHYTETVKLYGIVWYRTVLCGIVCGQVLLSRSVAMALWAYTVVCLVCSLAAFCLPIETRGRAMPVPDLPSLLCPLCPALSALPCLPCPVCRALSALSCLPCPVCTALSALPCLPCPALPALS